MEDNVGKIDKYLRIITGAIMGTVSLLVLGQVTTIPAIASLPSILSPILGVISLILLATALTKKCGLYTLIGVKTCSTES
mgnify:CR=1 FL=1